MDSPILTVCAQKDLILDSCCISVEQSVVMYKHQSKSTEWMSASSSLSDLTEVEFPPDVMDGPQFRDLAEYIDQVTKRESQNSEQYSNRSINMSFTKVPISDHLENGTMSSSEMDEFTSEAPICAAPLTPAVDVCTHSSLFGHQNTSQPSQDQSALVGTPAQIGSNSDQHLSPSINPVLSRPSSTCEPLDSEQFACFSETQGISDSAPWTSTVFSDEVDSRDHFSTVADIAINNPESCGLPDVAERTVHDDDDFGDFESCAPDALSPATTVQELVVNPPDIVQTSHDSGILERLLAHLESALGHALTTSDSCATDWLSEVSDDPVYTEKATCLSDELTGLQSNDLKMTHCIWSKLFPLNRPRGWRLHWSKSLIYEAYLHSLHVEKLSAMPVFASQLRLLEPVRVQTSALQDPTTVPEAIATQSDGSAITNIEKPPTVRSPGTSHVDHNMTTSLGEPLITEQLDLDFFETQTKISAPSKSLPMELSPLELELLTRLPEPPVQRIAPMVPTSLPPTIQPPKPTQRSANVRSVLVRLPKLTYMRARSLIFPVTQTQPN